MVRVMRYLKYTLNYELHYTRYLFVLREYNDVNWIFVSEHVFTLGGVAVS
jgi:hypothetical protein